MNSMNRAVQPLVASAKSEGGISFPLKERTDIGTSSTTETEKTDMSSALKCSYRDYSRDPAPKGTPPPMSKDYTFPVKLHKILSNAQFHHIITWLPHGRAWKVLDHIALEEQVIPLFFKHGRYSSFARQVNGWGFRRITHGDDEDAYFHEMFLRGLPHLAARMKRLQAKADGARKQQALFPNLAFISCINPLPQDSLSSSSPATTLRRSNFDKFLSSLSNEEAEFLACRRSQIFGRVTQLATQQIELRQMLPSGGIEKDAYIASLSDEEALVLALRREQDLIALLGNPLTPPALPDSSTNWAASEKSKSQMEGVVQVDDRGQPARSTKTTPALSPNNAAFLTRVQKVKQAELLLQKNHKLLSSQMNAAVVGERVPEFQGSTVSQTTGATKKNSNSHGEDFLGHSVALQCHDRAQEQTNAPSALHSQPRRDSVAVVMDALEAVRRADMLNAKNEGQPANFCRVARSQDSSRLPGW